jgi:DinB family protein
MRITTTTNASRVTDALAEFRATRARTQELIEGLTQQQFDQAPAPNRWSIGEVLDHMLLGERLNREQIARLIQLKREGQKPELILSFSDLNVSVVGIPRSVLPLLEAPLTFMNMFVPESLRNYLTRARALPFSNPDPATPRRGRSATELRGDLQTSLQETETLFQINPDFDYEEMVVQHPLLGRYDVPGLLRFMSAHEQRHQSQLVEVQRTLGFSMSTCCCGGGGA